MVELLVVLEDLHCWIGPNAVVLAEFALSCAVDLGKLDIYVLLFQLLGSGLVLGGKLDAMPTPRLHNSGN